MKFFRSFLLINLLIMTFFLTSCDKSVKAKSYVTVEINPGVELVLDKNNEVIAANGLNDDGKTLICDVSFEGKGFNEALDMIIKEASECGYLLSIDSKVEVLDKEVKVSITTTANYEKLEKKAKAAVNKALEKYNLKGHYEKLESKSKEVLLEMVQEFNPGLTEDEIKELSPNKLYELVYKAVLEKSELITMGLEKFYLAFKDYEFNLLYQDEILKALDQSESLLMSAYNEALKVLSASIKSLEELEYQVFVKEDSNYLKLMKQLNDLKTRNLKLEFNLSLNGSNLTFETELKANEKLISELEESIEALMDTFEGELEVLKAVLTTNVNVIMELQKQLGDVDNEKLLKDLVDGVNNGKVEFLKKFDELYKGDLQKIYMEVSMRKAELASKIQVIKG